jgi:hypothetical protein
MLGLRTDGAMGSQGLDGMVNGQAKFKSDPGLPSEVG